VVTEIVSGFNSNLGYDASNTEFLVSTDGASDVSLLINLLQNPKVLREF
jgi:hypothetical protein